MSIPRYRDADGDYDVSLYCPKCHWAVTRDRVTSQWKRCIMPGCGGVLVIMRVDYNLNPYKPKGYG